jgi:hypothetical protein
MHLYQDISALGRVSASLFKKGNVCVAGTDEHMFTECATKSGETVESWTRDAKCPLCKILLFLLA